jgi:hypothetical protein
MNLPRMPLPRQYRAADTPAPEPKRPRGRPRQADPIRHSDCLVLRVEGLAIAGYLKGPGVRSGRLKLLDSARPGWEPWVEVQCSVGAESGELAIAGYSDDRGPIGLVRVPTAIGPMWRLCCPHTGCGKAVRRLYMPRCDRPELKAFAEMFGDPFWWCRGCHGIRYRRGGKRDLVGEASRALAENERLLADVAELVQGCREHLASAKWLAARRERDGIV